MLTNETMAPRALAFLLSEANGNRSRAVATIASGAGVLDAGTVLGKIAASGKFTASPAAETAGIEGAEVALAILAYGVDATGADVDVTVVDRDAVVKAACLIHDASVDDTTRIAAKAAELDAVGIRVR
ncbi:head decoration protein [Tropicimonas sp. IMCC34043]|uniref:head decoration protein n=1 Tax=Tropicimonas sp. IMCC34043 TaxID=2248760 RepID=UPI001E2DDFB2|nr:head decoration protein [Tropicimonas sp. IMCC34043]